MDIVFGIIGTSSLLLLCYALYALINDPYEFIRVDRQRRNMSLVYRYSMLIIPTAALCYGAYLVSYSLLGWMPSEWGSVGENGYETLRSTLSTTIGLILGGYLSSAIGDGIRARFLLSQYELEASIKNTIKSIRETNKLEELKNSLKAAVEGEDLLHKHYDLYQAIEKSGFPGQAHKNIFYDAIADINRKIGEANAAIKFGSQHDLPPDN